MKNRLDKIPEIRIELDALVDFVIVYGLEENIDFNKVLNYFHALEDKHKKRTLERLKTKYHVPSLEEK